jgi:hypothetical protein
MTLDHAALTVICIVCGLRIDALITTAWTAIRKYRYAAKQKAALDDFLDRVHSINRGGQ